MKRFAVLLALAALAFGACSDPSANNAPGGGQQGGGAPTSAATGGSIGDIDFTLWWTLFKWDRRQHNTKTGQWIVDRYFGRFHPTRQDRWLFGDRETGACLTKLSWTPIRRHQMVNADASPDDPALGYYWKRRRQRRLPPDTITTAPPPYQPRRPQGLA